MHWIDLAQERYQWRALVNRLMNLRVPYIAEKFLSGCTISGFPRRAQLHEVNFCPSFYAWLFSLECAEDFGKSNK
jgi:hypothetical protein